MKKETILSDEVLVKMYKDGDSNAFGFLVERHTTFLQSSIFRIVKNTMLAEDILQDTFIKAMLAIRNEKYEEENSFKGWLVFIAHNLSLDYIRKKNRIPIAFFISPSGNSKEKEKLYFQYLIMKRILRKVL